jgi:hypothetical protein
MRSMLTRGWRYLLAGAIRLVVSCSTLMAVAPSTLAEPPVILPTPHVLGSRHKPALELVPSTGARVCTLRLGANGHWSRPYSISLGGPSRRVSWQLGYGASGDWLVQASCGTSASAPASLGTFTKHLAFVRSGKAEGNPMERGSVHVKRGWLPAGPPKSRAARAADFTEIDTSAARTCSSEYMTKAYSVGLGYGARMGFTPRTPAHDNSNVDAIWGALLDCVPFPSLTTAQADSMFKQMVCHVIYAVLGGAGSSWDFEAWREDPSWATALNPLNECQNWGNVPLTVAGAQFNGEILHGSLDTAQQKAAWLVLQAPDGEFGREHVLTSNAFGCLKALGAPGPVVVASDFLEDELPVLGNVGDEICGATTPPPTPQPSPLATGEFYVQNADGGIYWRSGPDWSTPEATAGNGFYPGTVIKPICYEAGAANVPASADGMWEQASWVSGPGSGSGWINEHFINDGASINQPSPGVGACIQAPPPPPPPPPPQTWLEQETPNHPVNTFTDYHNASGMGPPIAAGLWVEVSCKVYDPTIASVNPDGYWYRIASSPWSNSYYSPANTFMNGDPYGGPYTHNTDFSVPNC